MADSPRDLALRPLRAEDLEAVVALDLRSVGQSRRGYFERRLAAALRRPRGHLQLGLVSSQELVGFLLARVAGGEYGRSEDLVLLEALGVDPAHRHAGLGRQMLAGLEGLGRAGGATLLLTQVDWRNHAMLKFLAGAGFELAPRLILERSVERPPSPTEEELLQWPPVVRNLRASDLDAVTQIDRRITGQNRRPYLERKFDEALNESAIQVSLVVEHKGHPVAFVMARVDFGDFGHVAAVATLDTLGVDPPYARKGFGRAALAQMVANLAALHVGHLETDVALAGFPLLSFLYNTGFVPSPRLSFQRLIGTATAAPAASA